MNSSSEQEERSRRPHSARTRQRLLDAAASLIAELGWGRVTTRAVAERAGLPLGAVTYHFNGKQDLLTQAAVESVESLFPLDELAALETPADLLAVIKSWMSRPDAVDPGLSGVFAETMREAGRDPVLRERMAGTLDAYRSVVAGLIRRGQSEGTVAADSDPAVLAALVTAAVDGLVLHAALNPDFDVTACVEALFRRLAPTGDDARSSHGRAWPAYETGGSS